MEIERTTQGQFQKSRLKISNASERMEPGDREEERDAKGVS